MLDKRGQVSVMHQFCFFFGKLEMHFIYTHFSQYVLLYL